MLTLIFPFGRWEPPPRGPHGFRRELARALLMMPGVLRLQEGWRRKLNWLDDARLGHTQRRVAARALGNAINFFDIFVMPFTSPAKAHR